MANPSAKETTMEKASFYCILGLLFTMASCSKVDDSQAIVYAEKIVGETLLSPSSAKYSDERVIERKGNLFLVHLAVDAQNVYGAMIREYYLVVVELSDKGTFGSYFYKKSAAAQRFDRPPDDIGIHATKAVNRWDTWEFH